MQRYRIRWPVQEMQETWVQSLGQEDPLEEEMATHSSIIAWKIRWTEESGKLYRPWGHRQLDMTEHYSYSAILAHTLYAGVIGVKMGNGYYTNE